MSSASLEQKVLKESLAIIIDYNDYKTYNTF